MSGSDDDWENDDVVIESKTETQFEGEDLPEEKKEVEKPKPKPPSQKKIDKKDYDILYEQKMAKSILNPSEMKKIEEKYKDLPEEKKKIKIQEAIDSKLAEEIFGDFVKKDTPLKTIHHYELFGKQIGEILKGGEGSYNLKYFIKEVLHKCKENLKADTMKDILDIVTVLHNEKRSLEKKMDTKGKKANVKPVLKAGKVTGNKEIYNEFILDEGDQVEEDAFEDDDFM